jgi:hypothetical protein
MDYAITPADRAPAPSSYATEERYIGYREVDYAQPYASFFTPEVAPVQAHVTEALANGRVDAKHGYTVEDAARRMSRVGYEEMETGYTALEGGRILVSVFTHMPGVTAEMWDWWFAWHSTETARYKLWHPEAHYYSGVGDDRSTNLELSDRERYRGNVSYVDEYLGEDASPLTVRFFDPAKLGFEEKPGETVIAARGGFSTAPIGFAWLVHQVRPVSDGCEMRSRFFVNDTRVLPIPAASVTSRRGRVLTTGLGRLAAPVIRRAGGAKVDHFGPRMLKHCAEEMNHLARILPSLHAAFAGTP